MNKKVIILSGLIFTTLVGLVSLLGIVSHLLNCQGPRLEFEEYIKDLGRMHEDVSQEVFFTYRNTGNKDLEIYGVITQCSCQDVKLTKKKIPPGAGGTLRVVVKPVRKSGPVIESIAVKSTDRKQPTQYLKINRFVIMDTEIIPERLTISCKSDQILSSGTLTVIGPTNNNEFGIVKVECTNEAVTTDFKYLGMGPDNRRRWKVRSTVDAEKSKQEKLLDNEELRLFTSDKTKPIIIPLTLVRELPVHVQPKSLTFVLGGARSSYKQKISLTYFGKITDADIEPHLGAPNDIRVNLVSKEFVDNEKRWIYEVKVNETTTSSSPVCNGLLEFRFASFAVPVRVPFSILRINMEEE